jgi:hypothetical protein
MIDVHQINKEYICKALNHFIYHVRRIHTVHMIDRHQIKNIYGIGYYIISYTPKMHTVGTDV